MRIGLKAGFNDIPEGHLERMSPHIDYLEFSLTDRMDWREFDSYGLPVEVVHLGHWERGGVNMLDRALREKEMSTAQSEDKNALRSALAELRYPNAGAFKDALGMALKKSGIHVENAVEASKK